MKYLTASGYMTPDQVQIRLNDEIARGQKYGVQYWRVEERASKILVGCCGLRPFILPGRGHSETDFELGFRLMKSQWGNHDLDNFFTDGSPGFRKDGRQID